MSRFTKATKRQSKARVALVGPSGAGKTYTALTIARELGERVALIDTERGSASKYADVFDFDALDLETHSPQEYVRAIVDAASEGYDVLVIDSLSHAWSGNDGALEQVDRAASRSRSGNSFTAWREVTPLHNQLVDAILRFPGHVIATMRAKTAYDMQDQGGKKTPVKIGLAPIQREGVEYEFDVVADMDLENTLVVSKTRCSRLRRAVIREPDQKLGAILRAWLDDGAEALPMRAIDVADPRPMSTPLASTAYGPEERARSARQVAAGAQKGKPSPTRVLCDGLIGHAQANIADNIDTLRAWMSSNMPAVLNLGSTRAIGYVRESVMKHATTHIDGLNEAGFRDEWSAAAMATLSSPSPDASPAPSECSSCGHAPCMCDQQ